MHSIPCLLWFVGFILTIKADDNNNIQTAIDKNRLQCDVQHKGFHVKLHCDVHGPTQNRLTDCILRLYLPQGFFFDPYEFTSQHPKINFTISKSVSDPDPSGMGKWFSWFMGSSFPKRNEIMINHSQVDVEAPQWLAEPMIIYFRTSRLSRPVKDKPNLSQIEVPLHMRYHLPSHASSDLSVTQVSLPHPSLICSDGYNFNHLDHMEPFPMDVVVPHPSDLIYVMPLTILFLTVGVVVLLLA